MYRACKQRDSKVQQSTGDRGNRKSLIEFGIEGKLSVAAPSFCDNFSTCQKPDDKTAASDTLGYTPNRAQENLPNKPTCTKRKAHLKRQRT